MNSTPTCYACHRFVNAADPDVAESIEYGDYGTVYSVEYTCPGCAAESRFEDVLREAFAPGETQQTEED